MSNKSPRLTLEAAAKVEQSFDLDRRAWKVLDLIVAEFNSDPMSVQCFDLRTVKEAQEVIAQRKTLKGPLLGNPFES